MKKVAKNHALFSASALLITALAACGNSKSSLVQKNGQQPLRCTKSINKTTDKLLENANRSWKEIINKLEMQYLGWGVYNRKCL